MNSKNPTPERMDEWRAMIGQRVWKRKSKKPFKSMFQKNTVKDLVFNDQYGGWCFSFLEDDSLVQCHICGIAE